MSKTVLNVYLADDDSDDRTFFSDALREIPIPSKEIERLKEMGASLYLQKPSSYNQLKTLLHKCLRYVNSSEGMKVEPEFVISI